MPALKLVPHDSPILRTPCVPYDFDADGADPFALARDMAETMLTHGGIGLAAPQVGLNVRVLAIASNPVGVLFNPKIVNRSEATTVSSEGCLSFPGLLLDVERPRVIRVRYTLPNGQVHTKQFSDVTARVICHEVDHLDGVTFFDRVGPVSRHMAVKKWRKMVRAGILTPRPAGAVDIAQAMDNVERMMNRNGSE